MSNKHVFGAKSSSLTHCDYNDASQTLKIKFCSGDKEHEYKDCPKEIYNGLVAAESPGRYFHKQIRGKY